MYEYRPMNPTFTSVIDEAMYGRERLLMDIYEPALLIENEYGKFFTPPPVGIYVPHLLEPIITPSSMYYINNEPLTTLDAKTLSSMRGVITDRVGNLVLEITDRTILSNTPYHPYKGIHTIATYVSNVIYNLNPYKHLLPPAFTGTEIDIHLNDLGRAEWINGNLDITDLISDIIYNLRGFVSIRPEYCYPVDIDTRTLTISRSIDVRAYVWMMGRITDDG